MSVRRTPVVAAVLLGASAVVAGQQQRPQEEGFRFRSGVELINVTATVTDGSGRFVPGLTIDDFVVYEDGQPQQVTHFSNERVPVSLGIAIDTSGSMRGEKIRSAREALGRFLGDLLDADDEIFLYQFSDNPELVQGWTTDRRRLHRALGGMSANGGTALYDTVAEALPLAQRGERRKKALLVISDGNDTTSMTQPEDLRQMVQESEVLVYAIAIDAAGEPTFNRGGQPRLPPVPFPVPGRRPPMWPPTFPVPPGGGGGWWQGGRWQANDRANIYALRQLTNDSGGRTEVVREARDLDPATASIADELTKQYYLAYPSPQLRDGRWHTIDVRVKAGNYRVRARKGYVAAAQ